MSANVEAMVREGVNAFKSGRKEEARALLLKATELDQYNEQAWLWLSGLMDTPEDQRTCLENVLAINADNERAKQGLAYLTGQTSAGNVSPFSAASAPSSTPPSSAPTSVEWGLPDDAPTPAWSTPAPIEPTADVLDDWVSNLNLSGSDAQTPSNASVFGDFDMSSSGSSPFGDFDVDEDMFAGGPFSAPPAEAEVPARTSNRSAPPPRAVPPESRGDSRSSRRRDTGLLLDDLDDDPEGDLLEAGEAGLFGYIPAEIAPTRLPGTREGTPILLRLAVVLLILLNIGVGSFVMFSLLS